MTGAMIIVEADLPQGTPCECVEMGTADTFRKYQSSDRNVALQHARHALLQLHRWNRWPGPDGTRDVGRAIQVLCP